MLKKNSTSDAARVFVLVGILAVGIIGPVFAKPVAVKPGLWKWTFRESNSMGGQPLVQTSTHCMRTASESDLLRAKSGPAGACFRHEHAISAPGNRVIYTFACRQSRGPVETLTRGRYVVIVAPDHLSASLAGRMVTLVSGTASMRLITHVRGTGNRVGACH